MTSAMASTPPPSPRFEARLHEFMRTIASTPPGASAKTIAETMRADEMTVRKALAAMEARGVVRSEVVSVERATKHFNRKRGGFTMMTRQIKIRHFSLGVVSE